ncbi:FAD-dependent oxidoreductase, partial [Thermodesulfobacteriota bacterium]
SRERRILITELETQVLIIGGGVTGAAVARELSRYEVDVMLVEKEWDVAGGQTKCNGGIVYSARGLTWARLFRSLHTIRSTIDQEGVSMSFIKSFRSFRLNTKMLSSSS